MKRINVSADLEHKTEQSEMYYIDELLPICYKLHDNTVAILFLVTGAGCNMYDKYVYTLLYLEDEEEKEYFTNHHLNIENIKKDPVKMEKYSELTKSMNNNTICTSSFILKEIDKGKHLACHAYMSLDQNTGIQLDIELRFDKKLFIKLYTFFYQLEILHPMAEIVFMDTKFNVMKFINVNTVKMLGSTTDIGSKVVTAHYEAGVHPSIYKFNYIAPRNYPDKVIKGLMDKSLFMNLFGNDPIGSIILYEPHADKVYLLLEEKNIRGEFKSIVVLVFTKEFYDKTNLIDYNNIYTNLDKGEE